MSRICHNPDTLFDSLNYGFSQIVETHGTRVFHISGQTAWGANEKIVGVTRYEQMVQCFKNISLAMTAVGGTLDDIASLRIYMVNYHATEIDTVASILKAFFPKNPPATTWIGVQSLAQQDYLVEIEATAVL